MDRTEIIRLAKEAGMTVYQGDQDRVLFDGSILDALERFAHLVADAERERCAKVCDRKKKEFAEALKDMADESLGAGQCAAAIRAMEGQ